MTHMIHRGVVVAGNHACELTEHYTLVSHKREEDTTHDRLNVVRSILDDLQDDSTWGFNPQEAFEVQGIMKYLDALHHDFTERTQSTHD